MANEKVQTNTPVTTWEMIQKCSPYRSCSPKFCYLCLNKKMEIAAYRGNNLPNEEVVLISKCRHQNKYTLSKYDTKD